jgi:hypothetical protein
MASIVLNEFKRASVAGEIDLNADDIRVRLVMSNTTCDTENDGVVTLANYTAIDPCDGANYVDKALAGEAVNKDDVNDRAEFDATDVTWTALGVGTRTTVGVLVYKYVGGSNATDLGIAFIEFASPVTHDGTDFTIQWNAEGILQLT